jgi:hypothetical protein
MRSRVAVLFELVNTILEPRQFHGEMAEERGQSDFLTRFGRVLESEGLQGLFQGVISRPSDVFHSGRL